MAQGELWATLVTALDPVNVKAMPAVLQSTIDMLETELAKARAALEELQSHPTTAVTFMIGEDVTADAVAVYKDHLVGRASGVANTYRSRYRDLPGSPQPARVKLSLLDILSNSLVLDHLAPYLSISSLLSLASTSTVMRSRIMDTPYVFR